MKKITKNTQTTKLPMPGKVKRGFRFYCAMVLALVVLLGCSMSALGDFLPPFAMCRAFPCSDYYGGSVAMLDIQRLSA